jgi:DNA end-binding protein Ku
VAIARFVFRNKEHLAAIRPAGDVLTLTTMRFADEVVAPSELADAFPAESPKLAKRELEMAQKLIDSLTRRFDPAAYRDEHREALLAMIERKAEGEEIVKPPAGEELEPTRAPDLMAALERSIAAVGDRGKAGKEKAKKRPAAPKAKAAPKRAARRAKSSSST